MISQKERDTARDTWTVVRVCRYCGFCEYFHPDGKFLREEHHCKRCGNHAYYEDGGPLLSRMEKNREKAEEVHPSPKLHIEFEGKRMFIVSDGYVAEAGGEE